MFASWRPFLIAALVLAPAPAAAAALAPDELMELESLLRDLGFDPGTVDGVVDDFTTAAIGRYQDFALLSGPPEPDRRLLDELRGVAAAYAALSADKPETPPEPVALPQKEIVPPPPPPPKLTAPPLPEALEAPQVPEAIQEGKAQIATLPPTAMPESPPPEVEAPDPAAAMQARIDAELLRFLHRLNDGSLTREALARQLNAEGRSLLQQAQYDAAILKFSVAIHLDPTFAGAYSNRGTAYHRSGEAALAKADFDKTKELGFGGLRAKGAENPLD